MVEGSQGWVGVMLNSTGWSLRSLKMRSCMYSGEATLWRVGEQWEGSGHQPGQGMTARGNAGCMHSGLALPIRPPIQSDLPPTHPPTQPLDHPPTHCHPPLELQMPAAGVWPVTAVLAPLPQPQHDPSTAHPLSSRSQS